VAVGFTALANVLLLATLVFREWLPSRMLLVGYGVLAVVWLVTRWQSRSERRAQSIVLTDEDELLAEARDEPPAERDLLFREAQSHYLANDWVATEQALLKLLKHDARDVESRLMLATLWRHQGRGAEALRQLDRLERLEAASEWQHEIAAERAVIEQAKENEVRVVPLERTEPPEECDEECDEAMNRRRAA